MPTWYLAEAVPRLRRRDPRAKEIILTDMRHTDRHLAKLVDCLLANPNIVTSLYLDANYLTDQTGVKLAQYVAASSTIQALELNYNRLGPATFLALAAALRVNSSLKYLGLFSNKPGDRAHIDPAFIEALRLNPLRPARSKWVLYVEHQDDFKRLQDAAGRLGHPSLQQLLLRCVASK